MKSLNSNKKEILEKGFKIFLIRVVGYGFGFLFTWILANKYGAKFQGVFSIAFLFLSLGTMIAKLGVETALVKWIASSINLGEKKEIYFKSVKLVLISSLFIGVFIFTLAPLIALMYNKPDVESSIKIAAIAVPCLSLLDISGSYFKGEKKTNTFGLYFHLGKFLVPFIIISTLYLFAVDFIEVPIISYLVGLFVVSSIIILHILRLFKGTEKIKKAKFSTKDMVLDSYPMMISSAIVMIMGWSDVFILGFYVSEEEIGIYSTAIKLATLVSFVYNAIATILTPKIAEFYHQDQFNKLRETVNFSAKAMFIFGVPIFAIIFIFSDLILGFFGPEYLKGRNVLRILLIAQLTNVITGAVGPIMQMTGKQKLLQKFILFSLIFNLILSLILVQYFQLEGVAVASAFGMILWNVLGALFIYKNMHIKTWFSY
jgi:O-antigen/teichoic acid export membrane protein